MMRDMDKETKRALVRACRPDEPVPPDDERHFDFDAHGLRGQPWRAAVAEVIEFADGPTAQGVSGLRGSGKTTELEQLAADLQRSGYRVVLADAGAWVRDDAPVSVETIWLALILALYPDGGPESVGGWLAEYARRTWTFLTGQVGIKEVVVKFGAAKARTDITMDDTLFQRVAHHLKTVKGLREQVFDLLDHAARGAKADGTPLVIFLDGIEKRATGDLEPEAERERYRNHWFNAFLSRAPDLRPPVHVVYTVPSFMIRRAAEFGAAFGQELQFLPMVRVWRRGEQGGAVLDRVGMLAMREALFLRIPRSYFDAEETADLLIMHSGGYMRDLLRMATQCVYACRGGVGCIDGELAEGAITRVRQTYLEGLERGQKLLLGEVQRSGDYPLERSNGAEMDRLLQSHLMMRYHNSHIWYAAHPLLWNEIDIEALSPAALSMS